MKKFYGKFTIEDFVSSEVVLKDNKFGVINKNGELLISNEYGIRSKIYKV